MERIQGLLGITLCLLLMSSCADEPSSPDSGLDGELLALLDVLGGKEAFVLPASHEYDLIPQDPNNRLNGTKVELGRKLFFETGLGIEPEREEGMHTYSCGSCHVPGRGFQAGIRQALGEGGIGFGYEGEGRLPNPAYLEGEIDALPIRSPSNLNLAYTRTTMWNGRLGAEGANAGTETEWQESDGSANNFLGFLGPETQAITGLEAHRFDVDMALVNSTYYKDLFDFAFPEIPEGERYTILTAGLAIAAFERSMTTYQAPFQQWLRGDPAAMTTAQKEGALLFFGKAGCVDCHSGPALNSERFHALGMADMEGQGIIGDFPDFDTVRRGRGGFTGDPADDYKFKTPQLYSLKSVNFLGHGASFGNLREVVEYKNAAVPQSGIVPPNQLAAQFQPLGLTDVEVDFLVDFLENSLDDASVERYAPNSVGSGNCFPNNDEQARVEMGCE